MTRHIVKVETNDPLRPRLDLSISGEVREFANVNPRYVTLAGKAGTAVSAAVTVTPYHPFKILEARAQHGTNIRMTMQELVSNGKKAYTVTIENTLGAPGTYLDTIILRTDSAIKPEITIGVRGDIS